MVSFCSGLACRGRSAAAAVILGWLVWAAVAASPGYALAAQGPDTNALLTAWVSAQTSLQSWSADFVQTRTLKALVQPLTATGHIWFAMPDYFRWEVGSPAQTIAVRQPDQLLIIYPRLKRAERYALADPQFGQWRDAVALLEAGFPKSRADLEARFRVLAVKEIPEGFELALQPKQALARRMMTELKFTFQTNVFALRAMELAFSDGSRMRNDFSNARRNPELPADIFKPALGPEYKIVEPLKR